MCIYDACTMVKLEWHIYISRLHILKKNITCNIHCLGDFIGKNRNLVEMFEKYKFFMFLVNEYTN